jgi:hypothetical protein
VESTAKGCRVRLKAAITGPAWAFPFAVSTFHRERICGDAVFTSVDNAHRAQHEVELL